MDSQDSVELSSFHHKLPRDMTKTRRPPRIFGTNIANISASRTIVEAQTKPSDATFEAEASINTSSADVGSEPRAKRPLELIPNKDATASQPGRERRGPVGDACMEYAGEIEEHMYLIEGVHLAKAGYMAAQPDVTDKMREILVDWLAEVHLRFKLRPETLYLTVNLIDRYLEKAVVSRKKLQLVGVAAMLVACKYEEIYAPEVKDFAYITDNSFNREEIMDMEYRMLKTLGFDLNAPSSYRFLQMAAAKLCCDPRTVFLAQFFLELALVKYHMLKYKPSVLANASLCLARRVVRKVKDWDTRNGLVRYPERELRGAMRDIILLVRMAEKSSLQAVRSKFALEKFMQVAKVSFKSKPSGPQQKYR